MPIDHYIGSSLKYIVLNVVRRATVRGFGQAVLDPPYQDNGTTAHVLSFYLICMFIDLLFADFLFIYFLLIEYWFPF